MIPTATSDAALDLYRKPYSHPPFELGQIFSTPGARGACHPDDLMLYLSSHARGNWGAVDIEHWKKNDEAVVAGLRLQSAYPIDPSKPCKGRGENTLWIVTEADRSVTTILLPREFS